MFSLFCRLFLLIVPAVTTLACGSLFLTGTARAQALVHSAETEGNVKAVDGYQQSVQNFLLHLHNAREITTFLQKINDEAKNRAPGNLPQQQAYLTAKLNEIYPGSTFDGKRGKIVLKHNREATFDSTLKVDSFVYFGEVTVTYLVENQQISISYGVNSITITLDSAAPPRSRFTHAVIPTMRVQAEKALTIQGYRRTTSDSLETSVLNDAFQVIGQVHGLDMEKFAIDAMSSPVVQSNIVRMAKSGYLARHPAEYQKGAAPGLPAAVARPLGISAAKGGTFLVGMVLVAVLVSGLYWGGRLILFWGRMLFMDDSTRQYVRKHTSLTRVVLKSLGEIGRSLWGRNTPWSRKYYLTTQEDCWLLSDSKIDLCNLESLPDNLIEVCLRDENFKILISRVRGIPTDIVVRTEGYTREELVAHLREMSTAFRSDEMTAQGVAVTP